MARASKASAASKKKAATPKKATTKAASTKAKSSGSSKASTKTASKSAAKATKKAAAKESAPKTSAKKAATATKPSRKKSPFDSKFLERMRKLLHVERDTYERQAKQLRAEADSLVMDMDPGDVQFDEESGEGDTLNIERERDLALSAQASAAVDEIDRALAKMDAGTYGICERCGNPIPKARLKALPYAALCVACKSGGLSRR